MPLATNKQTFLRPCHYAPDRACFMTALSPAGPSDLQATDFAALATMGLC